MKCNIIEGENEKLRSVCFEEIEKIVDHLYEEIIDTECLFLLKIIFICKF